MRFTTYILAITLGCMTFGNSMGGSGSVPLKVIGIVLATTLIALGVFGLSRMENLSRKGQQ